MEPEMWVFKKGKLRIKVKSITHQVIIFYAYFDISLYIDININHT